MRSLRFAAHVIALLLVIGAPFRLPQATAQSTSMGVIVNCWNGSAYVPCQQSPTTPGMSVQQLGAGAVATGQVSVGTSATQIVAARAGRRNVCVTNTGTTVVYLGAGAVTTATGDYLTGVAGTKACYDTQAAIFGVVGTGTQAVSYVENY